MRSREEILRGISAVLELPMSNDHKERKEKLRLIGLARLKVGVELLLDIRDQLGVLVAQGVVTESREATIRKMRSQSPGVPGSGYPSKQRKAWLRCEIEDGLFGDEVVIATQVRGSGEQFWIVPKAKTQGNKDTGRVRVIAFERDGVLWAELPTCYSDSIAITQGELVGKLTEKGVVAQTEEQGLTPLQCLRVREKDIPEKHRKAYDDAVKVLEGFDQLEKSLTEAPIEERAAVNRSVPGSSPGCPDNGGAEG